MTKHFSLSVLAILASFSVSAATLDVHGEIKVNGKTVIDGKGNLIQNKSDLIDLDDYFNVKPNSIVTLKSISSENTTYNFYYDENGRQSKEDQSIDGTVTWSMEWKDRTEMSNVVENISQWSSEDLDGNIIQHTQKTTHKNEFITSTGHPPVKMGITTARGDIYTQTLLTSTNENDTIGKIQQITESQYLTVLDKTSYKSENINIEDCIIVLQDASWMEVPQIRTYCKDYGLVQFGDFKL
ncbi:hypothetical protein [Photobacterium phosphoreum]|jgi:hypothetical protein|uniref:hypothetical protein n=1 Tax=Photobacterium phosphoreum TaxID=659 RepID=UPI001E514C37|nr:hypothetical protein [Photobacterium phosphoreum]MCD9519248.1 hypothetical protein [Photobacterium phosphoreum]